MKIRSPLRRVGSCNHCGKCCKPPIVIENACIERGQDTCKFYTDQPNSPMYGHCLIYGRGDEPITAIKDRFGSHITAEQIDWFNDNCVDYPLIKDIEAGYKLLPECSFSFELVTDA